MGNYFTPQSMAAPKGKRPKNTLVQQSAIQQVETLLQSLPEKQAEEVSVRGAVHQLKDQLKSALERGYSYDELVGILAEQGINLTAATLKAYLPPGKRQAKGATKRAYTRKPKATQAGSMAPVPAPEADRVPTATPAEAKPSPKTKRTTTKTTKAPKATPTTRRKKAAS